MTDSNLTELERRVTDVLHHHAEVAMSTTDTETQYAGFLASTESSVRRRRVAWGIGAVTAAAALMIALVLGGVPRLFSNDADTMLPARARTPVQIAADFVDAFAAYDAAKAAQDVAIGGEDELSLWPGDPSLREGLAWAEAAGFKILPEDCVTGRPSTLTIATCHFDWHFLGSDRLGWPPREGSFSIQVLGGQIVRASTSMDWNWAGLRQDVQGDLPMWRQFVPWMEREHPDDLPAMIVTGAVVSPGYQTPTFTDESVTLWAKYVDEWVASQQ